MDEVVVSGATLRWAVSLDRVLRHSLRLLARYLRGDVEDYVPYLQQ